MAIMFQAVADYLKYALKKKYIREDNLYLTDKEVIEMININLGADEELRVLWKRTSNKKFFENNPDNFDEEVICKSRAVDPLCISENGLKPVSEIDPAWREIVLQESKPKKYYLRYKN